MKKKLILALLTALLLLLASSYALAENYPSHSCDCGENTWSTWQYSSEAQHYSFCIGCGAPEYGDHYGGMATCIAQAICEGCGSAYGTTGNKHFNLSDWEFFNDALHTRFCLDCGAPDTKEFGNHSGSNGSCIAFCDDCGSRYPDLNGKHNMSGWMPYDDTQHYRYCLDCNLSSTYEYASHTGGTATCNEQAVCEGCYATYGELDPNNHDWGDWFWCTASTHLRECRDCPASEEGNHTGGTATCMTHAVCEVCNDVYGERDTTRHGEYSGWGYYNGTQHYRWCLDCSDPVSYEYEDHYGGTATCSVPAFCEGCGQPYGPYGDHSGMTGWVPYSDEQHYRRCLGCGSSESFEYEDHYGGTATCQTLASCEGCGASYGEPDPSKHTNMSDWNYASETQHFRYCLDCVDPVSYEYEGHTGGDSSCLPVCEECHQRYIAPNGKHSNMCDWFYNDAAQHRRYCLDCGTYESNEYEGHYGGTATCTKRAVCEGCGTEYGEYSDVHPWGEWEYLDDTSHQRPCTNPDCHTSDYADHSGGDGSCWTECADCGENYYNAEGQHLTMSVWYYLDGAQHMRHCVDCGYYNEYEDHTGGTATCTEDGVCEVCDKAYISAIQHAWGEWKPNGNGTHTRTCKNDASHTETEDCTGGDASCRPICEGCDTQYNDANGEHRNMSDWFPYSGTQHFRYCKDCDQYEYANHHGGDGSCTPFCADCSMLYSDENGEHRNVTDWIFVNNDRHFRYCPDCGSSSTYEYADHSGGEANCSEKAVCEGCGSSYGDLALDVHLHMSEWEPYAGGHERSCLDCHSPDSIERAPHSGDGACQSACIDCHENFIDPNGEHHLTDWLPVNGTQHKRYCDRCYGESTYEYADHVGDGTCTSECKDCGMTFTDPDGTHRLTEWRSHSSEQHIRYCPDCELERTFEYGEHRPNANAEDLPCYKPITCADCRYIMGWGTQHSLSDWVPYSTLQHIRYCTVGGIDHVVEYDLHYGGTATCSELAVCEGCGDFYGEFAADAHAWGEWKPDANGTHTRVCPLDPTHTETADCTWGDWTHLTHIHHERRCTVCNGQELGEHTGGTLTCYSPRICDVCNEGYGSPDNSGLSGHPNPTIEVKPGTCYDEGYYRVTCDHPGCSMPFFEIAIPANGQHLYTHWDILGDHRHHTDCTQCGENADVACTLWGMYDGETLLTVCPVCGAFGDTLFELLFAREDVAVPIGTLLVRGAEAPYEGALYGVTVAAVYGGEVVNIHGKVTITLPVAPESFTLVRVDVTDGVETRTEVPFSLENGQLTFSTDAAGLFLLVPAE